MIYLYWVLGIIGYIGIGTFVAYLFMSDEKVNDRLFNNIDRGVTSMFWPIIVIIIIFYVIVCRRR